MFLSNSKLIGELANSRPLVNDYIVFEVYNDPAIYPFNVQSFRFANTNGPRFVFLNDATVGLSKAKSLLPEDVVYIGFSINNRLCRISTEQHAVGMEDTDASNVYPSNVLGKAAFGQASLYEQFPQGKKINSTIVFSDASSSLTLLFAKSQYVQTRPIRNSEKVTNDDSCLFPFEHMANRISLPGGGVRYERRDDIIECTDGDLETDQEKKAVEVGRTPQGIHLRGTAICGKLLGIPTGRSYLITLLPEGNGSSVWTWCFDNEDKKELSDTSVVAPRQ
jgi:hypothetical protein